MKPYDPKLRECAEEFKALCKKYDCAGIVLFVSPTHAEYVTQISPSWSAAKRNEEGIRIRSKKEEFESLDAQKYSVEATAHMFTSAIEWSRQVNATMTKVVEHLQKHMRIMWTAWDKPDSVPGDGN